MRVFVEINPASRGDCAGCRFLGIANSTCRVFGYAMLCRLDDTPGTPHRKPCAECLAARVDEDGRGT